MKELKRGREPSQNGKDFYETFARLGRERRRQIALRILRDQKMLADLYDHFLIQRSLAEPGECIVWEHSQG